MRVALLCHAFACGFLQQFTGVGAVSKKHRCAVAVAADLSGRPYDLWQNNPFEGLLTWKDQHTLAVKQWRDSKNGAQWLRHCRLQFIVKVTSDNWQLEYSLQSSQFHSLVCALKVRITFDNVLYADTFTCASSFSAVLLVSPSLSVCLLYAVRTTALLCSDHIT